MRGAFAVLTIALSSSACDAETEDVAVGGEGGQATTGGTGGAPSCPSTQALVDGSCVTAGSEACATGFTPDGRGGCLPVLPDAPCATGQMAIPGETSCRPVAACGSGTWGDIPVESGTIYVDPSHTPAPGTGTAVDPFVNVLDALAAAPDGGMIAVAAGTIDVPLTVTKPVRIWGRCPEMVTVAGDGLSGGVSALADGTEFHNLAVSTNGFAFYVEAEDVLLDRVWVHDNPDAAVASVSPASFTVRDSLIERASGLGVAGVGSRIVIERTVVREMLGNLSAPGRAIDVEYRSFTEEPGTLTVTDSVVSGSLESGIVVIGSTGRIERTVIRNTAPQADGRYGYGIVIQGAEVPSVGTIVDSYVMSSHVAGIAVFNATASVAFTTIDDVAPQVSDLGFGDGVTVLGTTSPTSVEILSSRIANASRAGIAMFNADVALESCALECNNIHLNGESLNDGSYALDNREGNACYCGDDADECKVLSESLQAPSL